MKKTVIRDAVHGSIELGPLAESIVDSQWMQRLRFIRQLSTSYLVFPSAQHTRFEHSLGAMHLSSIAAERLGFTEENAELISTAALLHDVGHGAFAHDVDRIVSERTGKMHEERGIDIVAKSELGEKISGSGLSLQKLFAVMRGKGIGGMLTSDLGTDRIDYLLRDAYFTGVAYSIIDADRLMHSLAFKDGEVMVTEKGRLAAESLLVSRRFMFNVVYYHPAVRIAGRMIEKSIRSCLENGLIGLDEVEKGTDYALLSRLGQVSELGRRVLERKLFKKAVVVDTNENGQARKFFEGKNAMEEIEDAMEGAGIGAGDFVVCVPELEKGKKFSVKMLKGDGSVEDLAKTSQLIIALRKEFREAHFVLACDEKYRQKAAKAVKKLF